ncbi:4-hydroxythreonine-4-phosphate dehydrogenase [Elioraea sp. Yellowstone]|jgi:4-hydroxythreonine-4-phosphate dehydrogenase|uniref:PdxA family dehydrogenase n=1 Tax=Elioraea sp. Yellowstone TaxID=2592070 RepID=UPI0011531615|nr:4-hydroxythreonine-4-phosphate dehydrogenase PdxA [Elioraea sp. Yellowstone]TQF81811.1 4-hydroxythreonine-4-phosphate dehydrogenase [Elioraea sp. Yellowstone]
MTARIGLMLGDATGIGPEVAVKALAIGPLADARVVLFADRRVLALGEREAGRTLAVRPCNGLDALDEADGAIPLIECVPADPAALGRGAVSPDSGRIVGETLARMIAEAKAGRLDAICFAPLNKKALHEGGFAYHDEHQMFAALTGHRGFFGEMNVIPAFSTFRVTSHVSLREALALITPERIAAAVELADATLARLLGRRPRIGVAALNPHAGENGLFGREEIEMITPTLQALRAKGIDCTGPIPADVIFIRARDGGFDGVVSMYHDQGQIATKLLGFHQGVTVTAGLDVVFTTPAHGTAFDIAGKGIADPGAMRRALELAARLANRRA